jgi:hypothetical protein
MLLKTPANGIRSLNQPCVSAPIVYQGYGPDYKDIGNTVVLRNRL